MLASCCPLHSPTRCSTTLVDRANSFSHYCIFAVANAHNELATSCSANLSTCCFDAKAITVNNFSSNGFFFASAHAVLVRPCALNSPSRLSVALANAEPS
eukprot:gnl/TRDRNA2_/TRDRNA2_176922_c10_seq19.p1 gnl/TRDRNA2_/TRDRNA2_176922_c10~~gnl/TRDRNA2_/TRDRNA2_176922_c10_seq19.p1  ORF type:complete len:100 (-),score=6.35 gnl/TRDRNA2_/TRDRNA2_176922_c10_seq19:157-456(-)